jgi:hypothetical protein
MNRYTTRYYKSYIHVTMGKQMQLHPNSWYTVWNAGGGESKLRYEIKMVFIYLIIVKFCDLGL